MMNACRMYASAGSMATRPMPIEAMFMAVLLSQQKKLMEISENLERLERNFVKLNAVRGWLFDVYPSGPDEMTVWLIAENGERVKLIDKFTSKIYVSGNPSPLKRLIEKVETASWVADWRFVEKNADFMENFKEKVLEISISDYTKTACFARELHKSKHW